MGIQFDSPWLLLSLLFLALYTVWLWREKTRLAGSRKRVAVMLRVTVLLLLSLALAGASLYDSSSIRLAVFAVDRSDSMRNQGSTEWLRSALAAKQPSDRIGVVSAGRTAQAERAVTDAPVGNSVMNSAVGGQWSNLAGALRLSSGLLPQGEGSRIILYSDGLDNAGDLLKEGRLLRNRGIAVDVVPVKAAQPADAAVESLKVPEKLYLGEAFQMEASIGSTVDSDAVLRLYEDNLELAALEVRLSRGENRFAFPALAKKTGLHRYRAEIFMASDGQSANNAAYAFGRVEGQSKVLIVEGTPGSSRNVEEALKSALIAYETIPPEMLPQELSAYTRMESVLLNNVPATRIPSGRMELLEQAVKDYGMGLMMLGGDQAFGLGGYFQTPVERALPVYMELKGKRELPSLALILVLDKSGSMSGENMKLAQEAAVRSVDLLREKDTVGVLAFDDSPWWVVKPEKLTDKEQVKKNILSIKADGGTDIYPALKDAYDRLAETDAQRKHIILLTDGQSAGGGSYEQLAGEMKERNITVSSVGIGDSADTSLLEKIAGLAGGRYYFTRDISTVPAIFSREAVLISRTYVVEAPFSPSFGQGTDWLPLFRQGIPSLSGYIAASPKETAEVVLQSPEPDPVLARWRYGAGKTVAWTSDIMGKWSADWVNWSGFPAFVAETVKWTFPEFHQSPYELEVRTVSGETEVGVKLRGGNPENDLQGESYLLELTDERMNKRQTPLRAVVPGEYNASLGLLEVGVYTVRVLAVGSGDAAEAAKSPQSSEQAEGAPADSDASPEDRAIGPVTGLVIPYPPEYRLSLKEEGTAKLSRLAELTGGRVLSPDKPEEALAFPPAKVRKVWNLQQPLLMAALIMLVLDIAVRRLTLPWHRLALAAVRMRDFLMRRKAAPSSGPDGGESAEGLRRLQSRKNRLAPLFNPSTMEKGKASDGAAAAPVATVGARTRETKAASAGQQQTGQNQTGQNQADQHQADQHQAGQQAGQRQNPAVSQPGSHEPQQSATDHQGIRKPNRSAGLSQDSHEHVKPTGLPLDSRGSVPPSGNQLEQASTQEDRLNRLLAAKKRRSGK